MDAEIKAMTEIAKALGTLESDAVRRVLKWAFERYQPRGPGASAVSEPVLVPGTAGAPARSFIDFPELFDAVAPETGLEKVLTTAYWFQVLQKQDEWGSLTINTALKDLGHPSTNIARDLDALINRTPRYVMQVRKDGSHQQARKHYRLTREGIRAVESKIGATVPMVRDE